VVALAILAFSLLFQSTQQVLSATVTATANDVATTESNTGNNIAGNGLTTTAVTATADFGITGMSAITTAPVQCLPGPVSGNTCPPTPAMPVFTIGTTYLVTVTKTLHNNGPAGPVPVSDTVALAAATLVELAPPHNTIPGASCTATPTDLGTNPNPAPANLAVSVAVTLTFTFDVTCTDDSFAISTDPSFVDLTWVGTLQSTDAQISDLPNGKPNVLTTDQDVWSKKPFNPSFTVTTDSNAIPNETGTLPSSDTCLTNAAAYPGGTPCEMLEKNSVNGTTGATLGAEPLFLEQVLTPAGATGYTISPGFISLANPLNIPNGTKIGVFGFSIHGNSSGVCGSAAISSPGYPEPAVVLRDGALPDFTTTSAALVAGGSPTPPAGVPWTSSNGWQPEGPETINIPADLANPAVWPTELEYDAGANALHSMGAPLIARYVGVAAIGAGIPVNVLVFNAGTSYYSEVITGDPTGASLTGAYCTPYFNITDFMGITNPADGASSPATPMTLRQCNSPGTMVSVGVFTRADDYEQVQVPDTALCSPAETPAPTAAPVGQTPTPAATPVSQTPKPAATPVGQTPTPPSTPCCLPRTGGPSSQGDQVPWALLLAGLVVGSLTANAFVLSRRG
jgi:hypothetical protein